MTERISFVQYMINEGVLTEEEALTLFSDEHEEKLDIVNQVYIIPDMSNIIG